MARKEEIRDLAETPHRDTILHELAAEYGVTYRMVVRCLDEFLGKTKHNEKMWRYANEGDGIPAEEKEIKKLKPGIYADEKLRLTVYSTGDCKWSFIFIWRSEVREGAELREKILGGSELSLAMARKLATEASRMLAAGRNPIDGSWSSRALQNLRS